MWGMGNRSEPSGPDETSERSLFRALARRNDSPGTGRGENRRSRRMIAIVGAVALVVAAVLAVAAAADNPNGSGWSVGDGTIPDTPGTASFPDPVGAVKELGPKNGNATKVGVINTATPPMLDFTDINPGNDLSGMWLGTKVQASNQHVSVRTYFAWACVAASTGFIGFEFQKSKQQAACNYTGLSQEEQSPLSAAQQAFIATCNPWANRQKNDFMVVWDQQGQGVALSERVFDGSQFGAPLDLSAFSAAQTSADNLKGEAAIDLTAAGILPPASDTSNCLSFANVIAATITGNSDQADFKDTILADTSGVGISNCAKADTRQECRRGQRSRKQLDSCCERCEPKLQRRWRLGGDRESGRFGRACSTRSRRVATWPATPTVRPGTARATAASSARTRSRFPPARRRSARSPTHATWAR